MKIANESSLEELEAIFNSVANHIHRGKVVPVPGLAAQILYPEIFLKPQDEYMQVMLNEILSDPIAMNLHQEPGDDHS